MRETPLVSICIPAYKGVHRLKRLLDSIFKQTYLNFEVIITDDSPDQSVEDFVKGYNSTFPIQYHKNLQPLGSPENWNESIRRASGKWIKIMHDDDWFASENSLLKFIEQAETSFKPEFIFSAYRNVFEDSNKVKNVRMSLFEKLLLYLSPLNLFRKNYIGHPSCVLVRRDLNYLYDKQFKWVVDFEYYIRILKNKINYTYTSEILINIGINKEQLTNDFFRNPAVEIPENHNLLNKLNSKILRNINVYDYYWRLYRNLGITSFSQFNLETDSVTKKQIGSMLQIQKRIPKKLLHIGIISKIFMTLSYFRNFVR